MSDLVKILFEFGFLALLGLAYYLWQRKKIINNDRLEIYHGLIELKKDLEAYCDKNLTGNDKVGLEKLIQKIHDFNETNDYRELSLLFEKPPTYLSDELREALYYFKEQVDFHKSKLTK